MKELYFSIDIETDGPIPGYNSMLSLGCAAFNKDSRTPVSTFQINLDPIPDGVQDESTMIWWKSQKEAWLAATSNPIPPLQAMYKFNEWIQETREGRPAVAVVYPTWDFHWVHWYLNRYLGHCQFGLGCLDIKTKAHEILGGKFKESVKKNYPKTWFEGCPKHDHTALQDAIGQGILFVNISNDTLSY